MLSCHAVFLICNVLFFARNLKRMYRVRIPSLTCLKSTSFFVYKIVYIELFILYLLPRPSSGPVGVYHTPTGPGEGREHSTEQFMKNIFDGTWLESNPGPSHKRQRVYTDATVACLDVEA